MATGNKKSSFSGGSDEYYNIICLPCHRDGTTMPAYAFCKDCQEHLCRSCHNYHKKATPSRHHKLQDKDAMPTTQQLTDTVVYPGSTDNLTTPCPHHKKEMIKLYCHDHKVLLCSICVALEHRPCHVDYIPDISDKIIDSRDYKHTIDRMDKLLKKCTTIKKETDKDAKKSKDSLKNALQKIKKYRQEINTRIDELQKKIEDMIKDLQQKNDQQLKTAETVCEDIMKLVKSTQDNINQLNRSRQANQLFTEVKRAQKELDEYEESVTSLSSEDFIDGYNFLPSKAITDALEKEKMLGDIFADHETSVASSSPTNIPLSTADDTITPTASSSPANILPSTADDNITPTASSSPANIPPSTADDNITQTCLGELSVKSSKDKGICGISGMTLLPPDRLILVDQRNRSIKLVAVKSKSIISHLSMGTRLEDAPCDITSTSSTQVAVTVPGRQHIQFITVSNNKLSESRTIQTDGRCWFICGHQDKLIVTYMLPAKLEILDMRGRVINRVTTDSNGENILVDPNHVQANSSSIYVADGDSSKVIILNWSGEVTGRITDVGGPRGAMALLDDGSLLVCDYAGNRVHQVSGSTSSSRELQDVDCPHAVCVDDRRHKLYISRSTGEDKLDNNILVYNI